VRREILDDLLEGRFTSRPDAAAQAASVGFEPDEQYCVVVLAASGDDARPPQTLAAEVSRAAAFSARFLFVVARGDEVVGIFRTSEAHEVVTHALDSYAKRAPDSRAHAGLSTGCRGIGEVARGYWEAMRALRFTTEAEQCIDLRQVGPLRYLEFSADSVARRLAAQRAGALMRPGAVILADTLLMYVECGLNMRTTAERLGVHLNTVHNRLERAADVLALPELQPIDLVETAIAIRICRSAAASWT
jgi:sugar diacid utilization regulator